MGDALRLPFPLGSAIGGLALCGGGGGGADPDGPAEDAGWMPDVDVVGMVEVMDWDLLVGCGAQC